MGAPKPQTAMRQRLVRYAFWYALGLLVCWSLSGSLALAQQISIPRVEQMPTFPEPYQMRDWKRVAQQYDSLVFDLSAAGSHLPLIDLYASGINYPQNEAFALDSYVGMKVQHRGEAINQIPAIVGATLAGVDKSNQFGRNWALMAQDFFNDRPEEGVYLNGASTSSGSDWWYETMPNVFFFQMYDLYRGTGSFNRQLVSVADQWLNAVEVLGGSAAPWTIPYMRYQAFNLEEMTPVTDRFVEPEAAGAIGWLLYHAWLETGNDRYRVGAEWAMEFLSSLSENPSYELQLDYGVQVAARMNAELGTGYDLEKMINWCMETGPLREWGTILGRWGKYDVAGLVGENRGVGDYAFAMNTFQRIAALAPVARYDDRFARAIGKYVLHAANAARLFYHTFLPDSLQDEERWGQANDPEAVIGHEAIKKSKYFRTPYATGDARDGGWAETNLALYGSSHAGYLGGVVDTTNVPFILKLDLLATGFFDAEAWPSYLIYNPYSDARVVSLDVGPAPVDLYDAVEGNNIGTGLSGETEVSIPPDGARVVVLVPGGLPREMIGGSLLAGGVPIDFVLPQTTRQLRVKALAADREMVSPGDSVAVFCTVAGLPEESVSYAWSAESGELIGEGARITWVLPTEVGMYAILCGVDDGTGQKAEAETEVVVAEQSTVTVDLLPDNFKLDLGRAGTFTCLVNPPGDTADISWQSEAGSIKPAGGDAVWTAPLDEGDYWVWCTAGQTTDSVLVAVRDFSRQSEGALVLHLPFDNSHDDVSAFEHTVSATGTTFVPDALGNPVSAIRVDGSNSFVKVANTEALNNQTEITVDFWMKIDGFPDREQYVISHGSWENRWKISIAGNRLRWTVNTDKGIKDLDSSPLEAGRFYHVVARYDGRDMDIYLDGNPDVFTRHTGLIRQTTIDLTIGRSQPTESNYGFAGSVDELKIFDYGIAANTLITTELSKPTLPAEPHPVQLTAYPNPSGGRVSLLATWPEKMSPTVTIYDITGRLIWERTFPESANQTGTLVWEGLDVSGRNVVAGVYLAVIRLEHSQAATPIVRLGAVQ